MSRFYTAAAIAPAKRANVHCQPTVRMLPYAEYLPAETQVGSESRKSKVTGRRTATIVFRRIPSPVMLAVPSKRVRHGFSAAIDFHF